MQIRVPGGHQRKAQGVGQISAELPEFAGAGDVNDVGPKFGQGAANFLLIAPEEQVVAEVALDAEAGPSAGQFQAGNAAVLETSEPRPPEHGEKGARAALGKIDELANGEGDAVDFVKGFAKQSYARLRGHRPPSSWPRRARRTAGRTCGLTRNAMTQRNLSTTC